MDWVPILLGIPVGVVAGLIASRLDLIVLWVWDRIRYGRLKLSGVWAEFIPDSTGRRFSIGVIKYDLLRRRYVFDGTNYDDSGEPYCYWKTVSSYLDRSNGQFHYTFSTKQARTLQFMTYGHGVIDLTEGGSVRPEFGYYIYTTEANVPISVSHSMKKLDAAPADRLANVHDLARATFPSEFGVG